MGRILANQKWREIWKSLIWFSRTSKERSMSSLLSLSGPRTPKLNRKSRDNDKTVTIKCQRLNSERQYEEVEVEVPAPIYDTLRFYNSESSASSGLDTTSSRGSRQSDKHDYNLNKNRTFSAKIRSLFGSRTWNIKRFIMMTHCVKSPIFVQKKNLDEISQIIQFEFLR